MKFSVSSGLWLLIILVLAGCAPVILITANQPIEVGGKLRVKPSTDWSRIQSRPFEVWTVNGVSLQAIMIFTGIEDGSPLLSSHDPKTTPTYQRGMTALDIAELWKAELRISDFARIQISDVRPWQALGNSAFRFEFQAYDPDGLAVRGSAVGFINDAGELNLVIYQAAAEHYYEAYKPRAEAVIESLERL